MLVDSFGRKHSYLRISLTDRCDLRCFYCMPEESYDFVPSAHLMQAQEIYDIAKVFVDHGVTKIRITGGEPLVRKDAEQILQHLGGLPVELHLTTNGVRLHHFLSTLKHIPIKGVNISLDTLKAERFKEITRRDRFAQVWQNINALILHNIPTKINVVVMRGVNEDEVLDFIQLTKELSVEVRFIEFMPFEGNRWTDSKVFTKEEILGLTSTLESNITTLPYLKSDTARKYQVEGYKGTFAIISTLSQPFCEGCNRIRLTADGKLKNCLFSKTEEDLLQAFRQGAEIAPLIQKAVWGKAKALGGQWSADFHEINSEDLQNRTMISIGG
ncbi:GTP 3',8-cyclase MoaA [Leadbetterella byssophila]|uniref:GTP 3',8-cyclase MoaA n=1 Tax=Leadbetterella byssophila TaxID=316068 RepID=UPI0039A0F685